MMPNFQFLTVHLKKKRQKKTPFMFNVPKPGKFA